MIIGKKSLSEEHELLGAAPAKSQVVDFKKKIT
jgi:hypothetical protein